MINTPPEMWKEVWGLCDTCTWTTHHQFREVVLERSLTHKQKCPMRQPPLEYVRVATIK